MNLRASLLFDNELELHKTNFKPMIEPISSTWSLRSRLNNPDTYAVELVLFLTKVIPLGERIIVISRILNATAPKGSFGYTRVLFFFARNGNLYILIVRLTCDQAQVQQFSYILSYAFAL